MGNPHSGRIAAAGCVLVVACSTIASCGTDAADRPSSAPEREPLAERKDMLTPSFCNPCHHDHYTEWQASMHAYAADDPVFRALNAKMQAESPPGEQAFCLRCHAPMAVRLQAPLDFASLDARPELKGVTCIFCHSVESSSGTNNNPLLLHDGHELFGGIKDPMDPGVHIARHSFLLDSSSDGSPGLCGPCHDIVTVRGAHIERTFGEWRESRFGVGETTKTSCGACHLPTREGPAAGVPRAPIRTLHDHSMVGVDLAITPFPGKDLQRALVQRFLDDAITTTLCVNADPTGAVVEVGMVNEKVGHGWPSGSNQDRRAWLEVVASKDGATVYSSGVIPPDVAVASVKDPDLFLLRDHDFDADGNETELFWRTATFTSKQLPFARARTVNAPTVATYRIPVMPDEVSIGLAIRPIDFDLLAAAEVSAASVDPLVTFRLAGSKKTWKAGGAPCVP
jgi:hypothetical protein